MNQQLIVYLSEGALLAFFAAAFIVMTLANIYVVRQKIRTKKIKKLHPSFRGKRLPTVTVLVYTKKCDNLVIECLDGIRKNRYLRLDVVVVNVSSSIEIKRLIKEYKQKYPLMQVKTYSTRNSCAKVEALRQGYKRSQKGDYVLVIDSSSIIPATLLRRSVTQFLHNKKIGSLHFNTISQNMNSITLIYDNFLRLSKALIGKCLSILSNYKACTTENAVIYQRKVFNDALRLSIVRGSYDTELTVLDKSVTADKDVISDMFLIRDDKCNSATKNISIFTVIVIGALLQTYSMFLAANHQSTLLLLLGWLGVGLWFLLVTLSTENNVFSTKIITILCVPIIYFLVYAHLIMLIVFKVIQSVLSLAGLKNVVINKML